MDMYHLLSAVVGAYVGLVFYSLVTPGQIPREPPIPTPDPHLDIRLLDVHGTGGPDGLFRVTGRLKNLRSQPCRFVSVDFRFLDPSDHEITHTLTTVENIAPREERNFDVRAMALGAVRFETRIDLVQF